MKVMVVYDMAPTSTRDVADGLVLALRSLGHEVWTSPTHAYVGHFLRPFKSQRHEDMPPHVRSSIYGAVNKITVGDAALVKPDVVLVVSGWIMASLALQAIKDITGASAVLYLTESPYQDKEQVEQNAFSDYDLVLVNEKSSVDFFREHHGNVMYVPHSFNPEVHNPNGGSSEGPPDVYLCGTGFSERLSVLRAIDWTRIDIQVAGFWPGYDMPWVTQEIVRNEELPAIYNHAKINLNIHRTTRTWMEGSAEEEHISGAISIGPRVYEVLASGGFLLSDYRDEMDGFLRDGEHLAIFGSAKELEEKIHYFLRRPDDRARIAAAGRTAVQPCTFAQRCERHILPAIQQLRR